jgi:ABC-type Fe3+-hydroxamate transport system substrate-binding protein
MRIVSLVPAATEIVCALGLADDLVGITDTCEVPDTAGLCIVAWAADSSAGPGFARLDVDDALVADLRPDLVLAPGWWRPARAGIHRPGEPTEGGADEPTVVVLAPIEHRGDPPRDLDGRGDDVR